MYQNNPKDTGPGGTQRPNTNGGNGQNGGGPGNNGTSILVRTVLFVLLALVGFYLFQFFTQTNNSTASPNAIEVPYSTFYQQVQSDNVATAVFQGQDVYGSFTNAITVTDPSGQSKTGKDYHFTQLPNGDPTLTALLVKHNVKFQAKPAPDNNLLLNILFNFLPWLLV